MKNAKIQVAIVDDHQIIIDGLISLLSNHEEIQVVLSSNSAAAMLQLLATNKVDILLTDVMMPGMSGIELAKIAHKLYPALKIIALSMTGQAQTVSEMIEDSEISGYLLKQSNANELATAIQKVFDGGIYFQEDILKELESMNTQNLPVRRVHITKRECQVIALIENDLSNKQIAEALSISLLTVETHRKNILRKTGAGNTLSLVKWAYKNNILSRQ